MNTCTQLHAALKQEKSNRIWKSAVSDLYPCSTWQVQVRRALRDFNQQTPPVHFKPNTELYLHFQFFKPAMARRPVVSSHFLDCLVRDLNNGLWTVTPRYICIDCVEPHQFTVFTAILNCKMWWYSC